MKTGFCYRCLKKGHIARGCAVTCTKCNGHHKLVGCHTMIAVKLLVNKQHLRMQSSFHTNDTTAVETSPNSTSPSVPNRVMFIP